MKFHGKNRQELIVIKGYKGYKVTETRVYHINYLPKYEKWEVWPVIYRYNDELDKVYHTPAISQYDDNYSVEIESASVANATISGMQQILLKQLKHKKDKK